MSSIFFLSDMKKFFFICDYPTLYLQEERETVAQKETWAIRLSNIANMVLFAAKVYASVRSGSLAIIASTLDSLLNLLSGFILWFTAFSMQTPNPYRYPIGKRRMQPLVSSTTIRLCLLFTFISCIRFSLNRMIEAFSFYISFFNSPCVLLLEMMCCLLDIKSAKQISTKRKKKKRIEEMAFCSPLWSLTVLLGHNYVHTWCYLRKKNCSRS